jgi:hypothetical protein
MTYYFLQIFPDFLYLHNWITILIMKPIRLFMLLLLVTPSCDDSNSEIPSITRIRYELRNSYSDTLFFDLRYILLSGEWQEDSFEIIPGGNKTLFSLAYRAGTQSVFKCSDRLVSLTATNSQGDARLINDPLLPGWWKHSIVPVSIDTFHICSCTLDSLVVFTGPDSLEFLSSGMLIMRK